MRVAYLSNVFEGSGVFSSQVKTLLELQSQNLEIDLVVLSKKTAVRNEYPFKVSIIPKLPFLYLPVFNFFQSLVLLFSGIFNGVDIVHCRGHQMASLALVVRSLGAYKYFVVADIRGAEVNEQLLKKSRYAKFYSNRLTILEKNVFRKSDYLLFVSKKMWQHYKELYSIRKFEIITTIINRDFFKINPVYRDEIRIKYSLQSKQVLIYVGGLSVWQNIDQIIECYRSMCNKRNDLFMFFISKDDQQLERIIDKAKIPESYYTILNLPNNEVPKYLNAADYGVIIREHNIVNEVASPIKLNEYLSCGLKVITSLEGMFALKESILEQEIDDVVSAAATHRKIYTQLLHK